MLEFLKDTDLPNEKIIKCDMIFCPQRVNLIGETDPQKKYSKLNFIESNSLLLLVPISYLKKILQVYLNMCEMCSQIPACTYLIWCLPLSLGAP